VGVKFDKEYEYDLFYLCHIHHGMSGRIKLLKDSEPINAKNIPLIAYIHPKPSNYTTRPVVLMKCLLICFPTPNVPRTLFATYLLSLLDVLTLGMTTHANEVEGDIELFLHQMIPHHINAVNMAKALFKTKTVNCNRKRVAAGAASAHMDHSSKDVPDDCILDGILRDIIGNQNYQINIM